MKARLESLFKDKYQTYVKRMSFRAGSTHGGEDIVMEAFARALKYQDSFNRDNIEAWFNTIMVNALRDYIKDQRMNGMSTEFLEEHEAVCFDKVEDQNLVARLEMEIASYQEPSQTILRLMFLNGYKAHEVIQVVPHTNANAVRVMNHRFRKAMWEKYKEVV